jgi:hypothetical protein
MDSATTWVVAGVAVGGAAAFMSALLFPLTHAGGDRNKNKEYTAWVQSICGGGKFIQ